MNRAFAALSISFALAFAATFAAARLPQSANFDGGTAAVAIGEPDPTIPPVGPGVDLDTSGRRVQGKKRSTADLYYFTPQEADEAAQKMWPLRSKPKGKGGLVFEDDVPPAIQDQMRKDMAFLGTIQGEGATKLHQQIFGAVDGKNYVNFFDTRVSGIGLDDCGGGNAVACVIPFRDPSMMWLTENFIKFSHPPVARMMVVYHEARHTETSRRNWHHVTCPTPFLDASGDDMKSIWTGAMLEGEPACDKTPLGSYGSSTIMLKNVQKFCGNCTDKVKMDAALYADDQLGRITDAKAKKQMLDDFR